MKVFGEGAFGKSRAATSRAPYVQARRHMVEALKHFIPEGTENAKRKEEGLRLGRELLLATKHEERKREIAWVSFAAQPRVPDTAKAQ